MATAYYDADDFYFVKSSTNQIRLSVGLGQEMNGGYLIFHGDQLIAANADGFLKQQNFIDDWLTVSVIMKDKPDNRNWASVILTLQEDSQIPKTFGPFRKEMEKSIDTICYTFKIKIRN